MSDITAKDLVDAIIDLTPNHDPSTRPVHAVGIGVKGHFEASDVASNYSMAEHFEGHRVPVTVRFSNGSGGSEKHDGWSDVRGMATRFHLKNDAATDLIAMTLGVFFAPTVETFLRFTQASKPQEIVHKTPWERIVNMLKLIPPEPDPMPGQTSNEAAGALEYANKHPFARLAVERIATIGAPKSYARAVFNAVHTFIVVAKDGERRHVRFSWQPVAGVSKTKEDEPRVDSYLQEELRERLKHWPARFVLHMDIGEAGDAFDDPTIPWPRTRNKIVMGTLTLTHIAEDQDVDGEHISFNPGRLVPGIEISEDPILRIRREAYEVSREMRGGSPCPFHRKDKW